MGPSKGRTSSGTWQVILLHDLARKELREAVQWYCERSVDAADKFVTQVEKAIDRIETDPESHALIGRNHRYIRVSQFPYMLIYQVMANGDVMVTAVANTSRRPGYWKRRT